ncbi:MAG: hypothetical protein ABR975_08435 [Vulcanimicrobiaceae bacterium]
MSAQAPTAPSGPVAITSCDDLKERGGYGMGNLTVLGGHAYHFFKLTVVDNGKVAADSLTYQIDFDTSRYVIGDKATFAPGQPVTHTLRDHGSDVVAGKRPGGSGPTVCTLLAAHFTDGTSWVAPSPAPSAAP